MSLLDAELLNQLAVSDKWCSVRVWEAAVKNKENSSVTCLGYAWKK